MTSSEFLDLSIDLGFAMMVVAVILSVFRMAKGPSLPDRVVALDMMTIAIVSFCGLAVIRTEEAAFLDVAIVLALVGFLATVALARYAERRLIRRQQAEDEAKRLAAGQTEGNGS